MDIRKFNAIVIDCDGILVNYYQGILNRSNELQQNLPQDLPFQQSFVHRYLSHYYRLSNLLNENGFFATHCFTFQSIMDQIENSVSWKQIFQFGRTIRLWPSYEDAYGALQYLKKFFTVYIRVDREPEDTPYLIDILGINESQLITRTPHAHGLKEELIQRNITLEDCLLITNPHLAELTDFPNIQLIDRFNILNGNNSAFDTLAQVVAEHQNSLRNSWH